MQIKGTVILSRIAFVKEQYGDQKWQEVLKSLSPEDQDTLHYATAAGWYPFEMGERLESAIIHIIGKGNANIFEQMGVVSAKKNLTGVHRHFLEPGNPQAFLAKASAIYKFYYDRGWREYTQTGATSGIMTTHESDAPSSNDCLTVIGWYKEALAMCGAKQVSIHEDQCMAKGSTCCRYKISWS